MALMHMQEYGHRPIVMIGGDTGLIGDPSGKTEMRQILTREQIDYNASCIQKQLSRYLDFQEEQGNNVDKNHFPLSPNFQRQPALMRNNADWLTKLNYIEFLRVIGRHFSVNKMLAAESYKIRLETGLNFIEFNYMLLQAYDFLYLFRNYGCVLQMGGNDQWGNMLAGSDLIRRAESKNAYSMTFPLITTAHGHKMGKTEKGTVWLDPELTSPYEYYQFWINTDDSDVERFLALFTLLPLKEIEEVRNLIDSRLNMAKAVLAFEATQITHGSEAAIAAWTASATAFNAKPIEEGLFPSSDIPREDAARDVSAIPTSERSRSELEKGIPAFRLACEVGLASTSGEARRLIAQGGIYINDRPIEKFDEKITISHLNEHGEIHLRKGKKKHALITVK